MLKGNNDCKPEQDASQSQTIIKMERRGLLYKVTLILFLKNRGQKL